MGHSSSTRRPLKHLPRRVPPVWVPDDSSPVCTHCHSTVFTNLSRRHHCRACGALCCDSCSSHRRQVARYISRSARPVRFCSGCAREQDFIQVGLKLELQRCLVAVRQDLMRPAAERYLADAEELAELLGHVYRLSALFVDEELFANAISTLKLRCKYAAHDLLSSVTVELDTRKKRKRRVRSRSVELLGAALASRQRELVMREILERKNQWDGFVRGIPEWLREVVVDKEAAKDLEREFGRWSNIPDGEEEEEEEGDGSYASSKGRGKSRTRASSLGGSSEPQVLPMTPNNRIYPLALDTS